MLVTGRSSGAPHIPDLVGAPDPVPGPEATRASAALRRLARREDIKAAVLTSAHLYPVLRRAAARYVAGETRDEAIATARDLGDRGNRVTVDHMGEDARDPAVARAAAEEFLALVEALGPAGDDEPMASASVSLDLSHIGLAVPHEGPRLAAEHLTEIAAAAGGARREVMISMEGSERTADILRIHAEVADRHPHVGLTVQAALHRTPSDLAELLDRPGRIRLVKGAYAEPATTAHARGQGLDASYAALGRRLVEAAADGRGVSIATHDPVLLAGILAHAESSGGPDVLGRSLEFEMLHGVLPDRLDAVRAHGYATRTYLVYGQEWWLYLCHRLAEHPVSLLGALADAVDALSGPSGDVEGPGRMIASSARPGRGGGQPVT